MGKIRGAQMKTKKDTLSLIVIVLLVIISLAGILSLDFTKSYEITNQYGNTVKMYGAGIYAHDSYMKAPVLIGTDFCILLVLVPLLCFASIKNKKETSNTSRLSLMSLYGVACYYAASLCFGVSHNRIMLLYIALFTCTLFGMFTILGKIEVPMLRYNATKGIYRFLVLSGIALVIAWMPDIIPSVITGTPLALIEVYTTEITYILDMGIIAPLCLLSIYLLKKQSGLGTLLLAMLFKICIIVGVMMIPQTICQVLSGFEMPLPALITKSGSFLLLGGFAIYFNRKLYFALDKL
ncbi:MAG: hypothetical protein K0R46_1581 [Herbinix sp.]|jgi:hypothetical protein|nr:hypothetical protein [Herbinix sp.]